MSILSENSLWMLLSRFVSMGALQADRKQNTQFKPQPTLFLIKSAISPQTFPCIPDNMLFYCTLFHHPPSPLTSECSWLRSEPAAWSCCKPKTSFCWSRCCVPSSHLLHRVDPPVEGQRQLRKKASGFKPDSSQSGQENINGHVAMKQTCTSIEVVSSTTLFITARTFRGSMVLTQSRVSTLFLNIWEIIRPCTCKKYTTQHK